MARYHGRCPMGQRCVSTLPHGHWQSSTFIAALRQDRIEAPFLIEGPVDAEVFTVYLEQVLCPQLRAGDTLILDNLSAHKIHNVSRLLSARGVGVRYLPPYSPDFNPIELAFAKLKAHLRQKAARTLEDLHSALATTLDASTTHKTFCAACSQRFLTRQIADRTRLCFSKTTQ
ncbi:MAG: IS630 family transposase [Limisphaerales bacterium]